MKKEIRSTAGLLTLCIAAVFIAGFMLAVITGARAYGSVAAGRNRNNLARSLNAYILTAVRSGDSEDGVYINGDELVIMDDGSYGTRIYLNDGSLMAEYSDVNAERNPEAAADLGECGTFEPVLEGNVLTVTTDAGTVTAALRSGGVYEK